jgi:hypothetical protein
MAGNDTGDQKEARDAGRLIRRSQSKPHAASYARPQGAPARNLRPAATHLRQRQSRPSSTLCTSLQRNQVCQNN